MVVKYRSTDDKSLNFCVLNRLQNAPIRFIRPPILRLPCRVEFGDSFYPCQDDKSKSLTKRGEQNLVYITKCCSKLHIITDTHRVGRGNWIEWEGWGGDGRGGGSIFLIHSRTIYNTRTLSPQLTLKGISVSCGPKFRGCFSFSD